MKTTLMNQAQIFLMIFMAFNAFAVEHNFSIRDSQTGAVVDAKVTVHLIEKELIPMNIWHQIKQGHFISNEHIKASFELTKADNKYLLDSHELLQYVVVEADGYQSMRTYIEPESAVKVTSMMLDRTQSSTLCQSNAICGYVYDKNNLQPLENVTVTLSNQQIQIQLSTDSLGYFEFQQVTPKGIEITISHRDYKSHTLYNVPDGANFTSVIDIEKGHGNTEESMKHPLSDVLSGKADKHWLHAKLTQSESDHQDNLRERPTGAVYIEPPASIRVGFNNSGGICCGSGCSTSQVYSLETYVQRGLDDEWIASWQADSLKAGSIPYRSYGAWHVLNEVYTGYDICAGPCCQAFGYTGHAASMSAAMATNGIMLDKNGVVARSEYSAQNNSWDDPNDGLNCSNADLSCGDGSVGSPDTGWTCLADSVSTGRGCYGHGRGMSQWGTQYHAQGGSSFADIVDHYYNASNNPSGDRSQYASTPIRLDAIGTPNNSVSANELFMIDYQVFNSADDSIPFGPLLLGASLVNQNNSYSDPANDFPVSLTTSGANYIQRPFQIPANVIAGSYELVGSVYLDVNADNNIAAADWKLVAATAPLLITVLEANDLIFKDSF